MTLNSCKSESINLKNWIVFVDHGPNVFLSKKSVVLVFMTYVVTVCADKKP